MSRSVVLKLWMHPIPRGNFDLSALKLPHQINIWNPNVGTPLDSVQLVDIYSFTFGFMVVMTIVKDGLLITLEAPHIAFNGDCHKQ